MSASETPLELMDRARGRDLGSLLLQAIGGWIIAMGVAIISGFQTLFEFLFLPFELLIDIAEGSVSAFITSPFGVVEEAAAISAQEIQIFDFFALPIGVGLVLFTLLIVILYLQLSISSNFLPGLFIDNRLVDIFFTSPEEEAEGEE